jgi:hypothetical protein
MPSEAGWDMVMDESTTYTISSKITFSPGAVPILSSEPSRQGYASISGIEIPSTISQLLFFSGLCFDSPLYGAYFQ